MNLNILKKTCDSCQMWIICRKNNLATFLSNDSVISVNYFYRNSMYIEIARQSRIFQNNVSVMYLNTMLQIVKYYGVNKFCYHQCC